MAFKIIESAHRRWRLVNAPHLVALASHHGPDGAEYVPIVNLNPGLKDEIILFVSVPAGIEPSMMVFRESSDSPGAAVAITLQSR